MKVLAKKYYRVKGYPKVSEAHHTVTDNYIQADVYYTKGGYSYFSYKDTPRGYFISAVRIGRYTMKGGYEMESHTLFGGDGAKQMVKEVSRQTAKGDREALEFYEQNIDEFVRKVFPDLELEEEEE